MCLSGALVGGYVSGNRICSWCVVIIRGTCMKNDLAGRRVRQWY